MENTYDEENEVTGFGSPKCDCGNCIDDLPEDEDGNILVTMETLRVWFESVCPGTKAA